MELMLRFAQFYFLYLLIPVLGIIMLLRARFSKQPVFKYTLGKQLQQNNLVSYHPHKKIIYGIRLVVLLTLAFLIAKPQLVDQKSKISVEGIDIMLVLDASGSMQYQDSTNDQRSRFAIAKEEAIRFIQKRDNDALGLVIFAKDAITRSPLTLDKKMLNELVNQTFLGDIDPDGTALATAMVAACNRLKTSKAKSKIMILLTDGAPSRETIDPMAAVAIAKKLGIKIYTIGIGSQEQQAFFDPFYGAIAIPGVNKELLETIANQTGGQSFMAHNAHDMRQIYDTIDQLERTTHEEPLYTKYYDIFLPFLAAVICLLLFEIGSQSLWWFGL
jgi:Ca-activated chloride channel family protein